MHKKPYTYTQSNQELIKRIELEKEFAKYLAKDLMSQRFGITTYCSTDRYDSTLMKKELCDWKNLKKPIQSRSYSSLVWVRNLYYDPIPEWVQWGSETPCCAGNPCEGEFIDPLGSSSYIQLDIPLEYVVDQNYFSNFSGEAQLYAFSSSNGNAPWLTVGRATIPTNASSTNLGGALIVNVGGDLFYRYQVYIDTNGNLPLNGAVLNDQIKFILIDGNLRFNITFANSDWTTVGGSDPGYNIVPAASVVDGCFTCYTNITINTKPGSYLTCSTAVQDCWYCGMIPTNPENPCPSAEEVSDDPTLYPAFVCQNDQECIYIEVFDQYNNPIPNYQLIIDGELIGYTGEDGIYKFSIPNASINNFHTINDCEYCFYTTGSCNQQKITIRVNTEGAQAPCTIRAMKLDCKEGTYVDATIVDEPVPDGVNTSWICDSSGNTYNGCVEIIDSQGVLGYSTQEECLENCEEELFENWRCVPLNADECVCQQTWGPDPANPPATFASEADCLDCEDCCCNPPPQMERVWTCFKDTSIPVPQGGDDCVQETCISQLVVGPIDWNNAPIGFYPTSANCVNAGCGCDGDDVETIVAYCESGTCVPVQDPSLIPAWIGPDAQFTSMESCEALCGVRGGQGQKWVAEYYGPGVSINLSSGSTGFGAAGAGYFDGNEDGFCCVFDGYVAEDYNYGQLEYSDQQTCEAVSGGCFSSGSTDSPLTEFPYICLESQGTPPEGLFVWTADVLADLPAWPNGNQTLQQKLAGDFYCKYYDGFDISGAECDGVDSSVWTASGAQRQMGNLKDADPNRLFEENTKFVIIPMFFSNNGGPWDGTIPEDSSVEGYGEPEYYGTGGNYYQMLQQQHQDPCGTCSGTYSTGSITDYNDGNIDYDVYLRTDNIQSGTTGGFFSKECRINWYNQSRRNQFKIFTGAIAPAYNSQFYYDEDPDFIPVCTDDDCEQMQGLTLDQELTALVNSTHVKNTLAAEAPDKIAVNYWDWVFQESSQNSEAHGVRTGGPTNYYQPHALRFGPLDDSYAGGTIDGMTISVQLNYDAVTYFQGDDALLYGEWQNWTHRPSAWTGCDFWRMGGPYIWLVFTLDEGYEDGGEDNIASMFITNVAVDMKCNGESCSASSEKTIDCAWGAPYQYNINPDQTL